MYCFPFAWFENYFKISYTKLDKCELDRERTRRKEREEERGREKENMSIYFELIIDITENSFSINGILKSLRNLKSCAWSFPSKAQTVMHERSLEFNLHSKQIRVLFLLQPITILLFLKYAKWYWNYINHIKSHTIQKVGSTDTLRHIHTQIYIYVYIYIEITLIAYSYIQSGGLGFNPK